MADNDIDEILNKLAKDVEAAVHALYRGEMRQQTAQARTGHIVMEARGELKKKIFALQNPTSDSPMTSSPRPSVSAVVVIGASVGWGPEDGEAVMKCVSGWLPMGSPSAAAPDSKCVPGGRELVPTWGQRERARDLLKRLA